MRYSFNENMKQAIKKHNRKITMKPSAQTKGYITLTAEQRPLTGNCSQNKILYQATVQSGDNEEKYI